MYITEDLGEIYVDISSSERIQLNAQACEYIRKITTDENGKSTIATLSYDDLKNFDTRLQALNTNLSTQGAALDTLTVRVDAIVDTTIPAEQSRAESAEQAIQDNLDEEIARAKKAEEGITTNANTIAEHATLIANNTANHKATKVALNGDVSGSGTIENNTINITTNIANSGVAAGTYGKEVKTADTTSQLGHNSKFSIPNFTVESDGRIKEAGSKTYQLPDTSSIETAINDSVAAHQGINVTLKGDVTSAKTTINAETNAIEITTDIAAISGLTTGTYGIDNGATTTLTPGFKGTFEVPYFTVQADGRVTKAGDRVVTLPSVDTINTNIANNKAAIEANTKAIGAASTSTTDATGLHLKIETEIERATGAEATLTTNLNKEIARAKAAEKVNADNIASNDTDIATIKSNHSAINIALTNDVTGKATIDTNNKLSVTATLKNSGVTAGSYGPSDNATPAFESTFNVPSITVDAQGRVIAASTKTVKIPSVSTINTKINNNAAAIGVIQGSDAGKSMREVADARINELVINSSDDNIVNKLTEIVSWINDDNTGAADQLADHGSRIGTLENTVKGHTTSIATNAANHSAINIELKGDVTGSATISGNKISVTNTGIAASGVTKGSYGPSANATPAYGATFNVPYITVAADGRITAASTKTVKIPASDNWTANLITGASATAKTNAAATSNGSVFMNLVENDTVRNSHNIVGSGITTVVSDANGKITIDSTLPTASSSTLGGVKIGSNISISSGKISVPTADGSTAGVTLVYPAASCTTFSSDNGTVTPLAVQKGAKMFSITRPQKKDTAATTTDKAITRWQGTDGDVQDSTIIIEDVTNTRDSSKAQVIAVPASGGKKMVYGYCTDQVDGTSFIGGIFDASATEYPYTAGLAIGGSSGNLLWKGTKVATTADIPTIPTALKNPNALTIQGNGTTLTNGTYDGSAAKTVNITPSAIGAAASSHSHSNYVPTSTGMTLESVSLTAPTNLGISFDAFIYANGMFVATSSKVGNSALYSRDGISWSSATMPSRGSSSRYSVGYFNGRFFTRGNTTGMLEYSEDGINWKQDVEHSAPGITYAFASGNGMCIALTNSTTAYVTYDGLDWAAVTLPFKAKDIVYGDGKFVIISRQSAAGSYAAYSEDGVKWITTNFTGIYCKTLAYGNGVFVAYPNSGTTGAYSSDGITWTAMTVPFEALTSTNGGEKHVLYGNGKFVAITKGSAAYSTDGITWTTVALDSYYWDGLAYGAGKFIAVYFMGISTFVSRVSYDGVTWSSTAYAVKKNGTDVTSTLMSVLGTTDKRSDAISASSSAGGSKIQTGSYSGNGNKGEANALSITFSFEPKMFICVSDVGTYRGFIWVKGLSDTVMIGATSHKATITLSGNTLSWYSNTLSDMLNGSGSTYHWVAFG